MDGIDIRFKYESLSETTDLADVRRGNHNEEILGTEMTQIRIINNDDNDYENENEEVIGSRIILTFHKINSFFVTYISSNNKNDDTTISTTSNSQRKNLFEFNNSFFTALINNLNETDEKNYKSYSYNINSNKFNSLLTLMFGSLMLLSLYIYFVNLFINNNDEYLQ